MKKDHLLEQAIILENEASNFGFKWSHYQQLIKQIHDEIKEVEEVIDNPKQRKELQEEIGDLIFATLSLCIFCKLDPSETLNQSYIKFKMRFDEMVKIAQREGYSDFKNQPLKVMLNFWKRAKEATKNTKLPT